MTNKFENCTGNCYCFEIMKNHIKLKQYNVGIRVYETNQFCSNKYIN